MLSNPSLSLSKSNSVHSRKIFMRKVRRWNTRLALRQEWLQYKKDSYRPYIGIKAFYFGKEQFTKQIRQSRGDDRLESAH